MCSDNLQLHRTVGDLTGTGEQPSGKVVLRKGTREVLETPGTHTARTRTTEKGTQGCSVWSIDGTLGDLTGTGDQPSGKGVLESGAGQAKETTSSEAEQTEKDSLGCSVWSIGYR